MKATYIGLDISKNCTGLCVYNDEDTKFYNITPKRFDGDKGANTQKYCSPSLTEHHYINVSDKADFITIDRTNLLSAQNLAKEILYIVEKHSDENEKPVVCCEGTLFGRVTGAHIDLAIYNAIVKSKLMEAGYSVVSYAPLSIKKGYCESAKKKDGDSKKMVADKFLLDFPEFIHKYGKKMNFTYKYDDVADAYACIKTYLSKL